MEKELDFIAYKEHKNAGKTPWKVYNRIVIAIISRSISVGKSEKMMVSKNVTKSYYLVLLYERTCVLCVI